MPKRAKPGSNRSAARPSPSRLRAEATRRLSKLAAREPEPALDNADAERLRYELDVHKFELETQNEELRAARLELEHGLARYTEMFDFAPIGYAVLTYGVVTEINHAGAQLLGRERSRLVDQTFARFVAERNLRAFQQLIGRAVATGTRESCELELQIGPERTVQIDLTAVALEGPQSRVMLAFQDITERKRKEALLAESERALRESDRRKDDFMALLSHELRNPLAPIRTGLFVLMHSHPNSDEARSMHAVIDRQVTHLTRLVNDLLDITRIRSGKIQLQPEWLDLSELVRQTVDDHRRSFELRELSLDVQLESRPLHVYADSARLVQVVSNLLGNAEKFTRRQGTVRVELRDHRGEAVLRVADDGVGIASQDLTTVFEPFTQAHQTIDRSSGGLGLGLSMVKGLVDLHAGRVRIHSEGLGRGTEVEVTLPLASPPARTAEESERRAAHTSRILVIDDHADAAETLSGALTVGGHEVDVAYDGQAGLRLARANHPDVVICDIGLPGMDGYDVARAMRSTASLKDVCLVALSGYARAEDVERATAAGFDHHMAKPADLDRLAQILAGAAARRNATALTAAG